MFTEAIHRSAVGRKLIKVSGFVVILALMLVDSNAYGENGESEPPVRGSHKEGSLVTTIEDDNTQTSPEDESKSSDHTPATTHETPPPQYSYIWTPVSQFSDCGSNTSGGTWSCATHPDSCEASSGNQFTGTGDTLQRVTISASTTEGVTQRGTRVNNETGEEEDLGIRCARPGTPEFEEAPPIVITVTREDFARLPVKPLVAHAGPVDGWLPVNMVNVLYVETESQLLTTELLDTPVAIRATPTSYHWDLGDGNTITTTNPGKPYPSELVSSTYSREGWYDITLTTTFSGQFSVNGGDWQDIDGTIEVASDPVAIYSRSLESRLVDGDVPTDEDTDPWIPERTPDTEGPQDPDARHREI